MIIYFGKGLSRSTIPKSKNKEGINHHCYHCQTFVSLLSKLYDYNNDQPQINKLCRNPM